MAATAVPRNDRNHAIDVFRALTMMLMIFVNDLWTLRGVPEWLLHVSAGVDGMGLSDVVFPAFLFIVGLSIPLAINNRWKKGERTHQILLHVLSRSLALLIMGVFHVNLESYQAEGALFSKQLWQLLLTLSFFLIWLDYPKEPKKKPRKWVGKTLGWGLLVLLAATYQGGAPEAPIWMGFYWWGILGLIGWAYLIGSLVYLATRGRQVWIGLAFLLCMGFSVLAKLGMLGFLLPIKPYIWLIDDGATPALALAGMLVTGFYRDHFKKGREDRFWWLLSGLAVTALFLGLASRPLWGIHKIGSSPSWVLICIAISMAVFGLLVVLVEKHRKKHWFDGIRAAGTSTLTCYLLPYIHYGLLAMTGLVLPEVLRTGLPGILKSLLYAWLIIQLTGFLERRRIRLKI